MSRIALNIICKNESHIILRMLTSVRPIIDLVVAVDTGSSDKTISVIKEFGKSAGIPTKVFERPFDNFCNSRNCALDNLHSVVRELGWLPEETWGFAIDCDEVLQISDNFRKSQLEADLYLLVFKQEGEAAMRRALFRLSSGFRWENPVHELIVWKDNKITVGFMKGLFIECETKGASWKGDLEKKFLNYARILMEHAAVVHTSCRTTYHIADSYRAAADHCKSKRRKESHYLTAKKYYESALGLNENPVQDRIIISHNLADTKMRLNEAWAEAMELYLSAYCLDMRKVESLVEIIWHYMSQKRWHIAYLFSSPSAKLFNGRPPVLDVTGGSMKIKLYQWQLLLYHSICCYFTRRFEEYKIVRKRLMDYVLTHMNEFSVRELIIIQYNSSFYLFLRYWKQRLLHK